VTGSPRRGSRHDGTGDPGGRREGSRGGTYNQPL
jgi:hypothetical protein